ncbi:hypothetical protein V8J36_20595 [Frigidibacter sp. MR17.14]|uniref:hypothetical protein n=1 Tax=Frigidibacter sp. MR17.14 TaxID=3126509 RepID=UPI003012E7E6
MLFVGSNRATRCFGSFSGRVDKDELHPTAKGAFIATLFERCGMTMQGEAGSTLWRPIAPPGKPA